MITTSSRIWCDQQGCDVTQTLANTHPRLVRAEAERIGWKYRSSFHFCPNHDIAQTGERA